MVRASTVRDDAGFGLPPVVSHSGLAGRLACLFAVAVLFCVSSAHAQVIEEGGFPVKGGRVSGEAFSLSCPAGLVVEAGSSVLLSCTATGVPEEGIRYGWESVSGEGLRLLSDAQALAPLFTAPLSGAGEQYAYRLTAIAAGAYRTATVTVAVEGIPGQTVGSPVVREKCDPFTIPGELGEGCVEDKGPAPFGFGSEAEGGFLFPEAPGLPDRPSGPVRGGGSVMQTPPRLECPAAIFMEELETGSIECHVSDASGEEHLEYAWEPVGGTTRDYLENPRLIPEDSPMPSVVAPEAPAYETLESFHSVETTFRYRYRLTATSRATGLSSHSEVEVFVSSSRPGVYCPLEVAVEEGSTAQLDCEGADPLSSRMDYEEEEASVLWEWEGLWGASTALLDATDRSSPLFTAPPNSEGEAYHYIASMTSSASGQPRTARRKVTVRVTGGVEVAQHRIRCSSSGEIVLWEGDPDHEFACRLEPNGINVQLVSATWSWTGSIRRLSATNIPVPVFDVPEAGVLDRDQIYTLRLYADYVDTQGRGGTWREFRLVVKNRALTVTCDDPSDVNERSPAFDFSCSATGPPDAPPPYTWSWSPTDNLTDHHTATPTFAVPDDVDGNTTYTYKVTANTTTDGLEDGTAEITVTVKDKPDIVVACTSPLPVYEGSADIAFDCSASGAPGDNPQYTYVWRARGDTPDMSLLSATDIASPMFYVPDEADETETYEYLLTVSAANAESATANVTVTVLKKATLTLVCTPPGSVYEGSADIMLDCEASGAPAGSAYEYFWTPRGDTPDTALLSAADIASPVFHVPDEVDEDETYEYLLAVSAANAGSAEAEVTVTVLNRGSLRAACADPGSVYEGSADVAFDCSASGAPSGSAYAYAWTARSGTSDTDLLSTADIASPVFRVPSSVTSDETYEYALTASARNAESATAFVTVTVLKRGSLSVACTDPGSVYEGSADIAFDCVALGASSGSSYAYAWRARGGAAGTSLLSRTDIASPVFYVPDEVDADETYEYLLTVSAANAEDAAAEVTVTVLNREALSVACADPGSAYEGSADIMLDCEASGAPAGSAYEYFWTPRGDTPDTALLSATDISSPTFYVPDEVDSDETYEYLLTVSAANAEDATAEVTVTVLDKEALALACADPGSVYEGSEDIAFDCAASGAPGDDPVYTYAWTARSSAADTDLLSAADIASPTFHVPDEVDSDETYEYLLTVSAANAEDATAEVTVTVLDKEALALACADPGSVYEGSEDIAFDCAASGAPGDDPVYTYAWTARGGTANTDLLIGGADGPTPTFSVPDDIPGGRYIDTYKEIYEYRLTLSVEGFDDVFADIAVVVLEKPDIRCIKYLTPVYSEYAVIEGFRNITIGACPDGWRGAPGNVYEYVWTNREDTPDTSLLSATDISRPLFLTPNLGDLSEDAVYKYRLTVSADNADPATIDLVVYVYDKTDRIDVACADPGSVYEGSEDIAFDCSVSGAPSGSEYAYAWTAHGSTPNTDPLISGTDGPTPTFAVPDALDATTTYEYLLTVSAENAESGSAEVTVTVLNKGALAVACADPGSVYEGTPDITLDCTASGVPGDDPVYTYAWTAWGSTSDTDLLGATDISSPVFFVPDEVDARTTYAYLLTASAANAEDASAEVTVTVLDKEALALACAVPGSVYEGTPDITLDCTASGVPGDDPVYTYAWTARSSAADTDLLSAADIASPTFYVPDEVSEDETYEYLLTVSAANAEDASAEVTVTVLDKEALALACADPGSVYEGTPDITLDCTASGVPGDDPVYTYAWTARSSAADTDLLSAVDMASPTFYVPDEVSEDETYEYLLTVSAANAEDATAEVTVTVLDRVQTPPSHPVSRPLASSSAPESAQPSALGVTISASSLDFGVQSADTQASLDPITDQLSTRVSGPYHAGRMTLSPGGGEALEENGEMALSIELASPVLLKRADAIEATSIVLTPAWSYAESCEQLSSQAIGSLYTETTLSDADCRLLRFGGELDLTDAPPGRYAGSMDVVLRSGESEETHSVEVDVTVVSAQQVITIGPRGVRFGTSRELPAGLTEEQNLSIYPHVAFLTEEKPHGAFELSNPSLIPLEITVSARFGYTEATENGREVVVEDASGSHLGDLSEVVDIRPNVLVLMPGEKGLIRYGVQEGALAAMEEKGYAAFFDVVSEPRQYVRSDRMPEEVTGEKTARVTMRVPGVYVPGEGAFQLRATLVSISYVGSLSATFLVETQDRPFAGEVVAYDGDGRELGRRATLVYTRSRVRISLNRMPEEDAVFLRFMPRGSGRVPEPASVEWDAPRRDIGDAEDKDRATTTETLARKP